MALSSALLPARYVHRQNEARRLSRRHRDSRRQKQTRSRFGGRHTEPQNFIPQSRIDKATQILSGIEKQQTRRRAGNERRLRFRRDDSQTPKEARSPFYSAA